MNGGLRMNGRCLCGQIQFSVAADTSDLGVCHCSMCQRWAAGPFVVLEGSRDLQIADDAQLGVYKSSDYGERCFCKNCGSVLFWRMADGSHTAVSAGALDDKGGLKLAMEIFIDEKPEAYTFAGNAQKFTGAEFLAKFASDGA